MKVLSLLALLPFTALACAATPAEEEDGSTAAASTVAPVVTGTPPSTLPPAPATAPMFPPASPVYCPSIDQGSRVIDAQASAVKNAELAADGCTREYEIDEVNQAGTVRTPFALCYDTPTLHAKYTGWNPLANACTASLPRAPAGQVYIDLTTIFVLPNCPSGCLHRGGGGW